MREIKFRGRVPMSDKVYGGKIVYGYLMIYASGLYTHWICPCTGECNYPVEPESVAQLIAVDVNGREVYEGDKVIRIAPNPDWEDEFDEAKQFPMSAAFDDYSAIRNGEIVLLRQRHEDVGQHM